MMYNDKRNEWPKLNSPRSKMSKIKCIKLKNSEHKIRPNPASLCTTNHCRCLPLNKSSTKPCYHALNEIKCAT